MRHRSHVSLLVAAMLVSVACGEPEPTARGTRFDELPDTDRSGTRSDEPAPPLRASATALDPVPPPLDEQGKLTIEVRADGSCAANGVRLKSCAEIAESARVALGKDANVIASVHADVSVQFSRIVSVLDTLTTAGVKEVQFAASPPPIGTAPGR